jgi:hypothetical protein
MKFIRVKNDVNGNPRYVIHFLYLLNENECNGLTLDQKFNLALKKSKKIGGKQYRGKEFGGGIVFQSYNIQETILKLNSL